MNLSKFSQRVPLKFKSTDEILDGARNVLGPNQLWLYSYFVNRGDVYYTISYRVSDDDDCNNILLSDALGVIVDNVIHDPGDKKVICFGQPTIDLMVKTYRPAIEKLALTELNRWSQYRIFDFDDMCQIGYLCMCELYNKGYYLHYQLIKRTFQNRILEEMRRHQNDPSLSSLEDELRKTSNVDGERLTLADVIRSEEEDTGVEDAKELFEAVKEYLIKIMGPRQFEQLFKAYSKESTSQSDRDLMSKVRTILKQRGYTRDNFLGRYRK